MKKNLLLLLFLLIIIQLNKAQQIGEGMAPVISNFNTGLMSGGYNGCTSYGLTGGVPDESSVWQHLLTIRHPNSTNNFQLQLGATFEQNDRLFFRKIATGNNDGVSNWNEMATRGSNTFNGIQIFNSNVGIGTSNPRVLLDNGDLSLNTLKIVLARLPEGDGEGEGTFLGVKSYNTTTLSFAIEHKFYGHLNSSINFFRGGSVIGGYLTFSTNDNTEKMRITEIGSVGIGTTEPRGKLDVNGGNIWLTESGIASDASIYIPGHIFLIPMTTGVSYLQARRSDSSGSTEMQFRTFNNGVYNESLRINYLGNVGIGTTSPGSYKLNVCGSIRANEIVVNTTCADFVFAPTYKLRPLSEVESFIKENQHLPEVAPAAEMKTNGMGLSEMQTMLLQKVEELTLYSIEQEKQNNELKKKLAEQDLKYEKLMKMVENLEKIIKK